MIIHSVYRVVHIRTAHPCRVSVQHSAEGDRFYCNRVVEASTVVHGQTLRAASVHACRPCVAEVGTELSL